MKTIEYTTIDKSKWGDGPWQNEPDKKQWLDTDTGLPCLIVRNYHGFLCGYVGVTEGHPAFKKHYEDIDVEVHGGLTFSDFCQESADICHIVEPGENDRVWWIGFDCDHCFDFSPRRSAMYGIRYHDHDKFAQYRDINYVSSEVKSLAKQLAELK